MRAMFDRIAGVYDLLNTAMTAGLHHRWRARAADLARVGPGGRVLDVATGTGDLALELARRVAPGRRGGGQRLRRGRCSTRARAKARGAAPARGACPAFEWARRARAALRGRLLRRGDGRLRRAQLRRPAARGLRGDGAGRAPGRPGGGAGDHHARRRPPLSLVLRAVVRPRGAGCSDARRRPWGARSRGRARARQRARTARPARAGSRTPTRYLPNSVKRFPAPARAGGGDRARRAARRSRYLLLAGGIVAIHAGTVPAAA